MITCYQGIIETDLIILRSVIEERISHMEEVDSLCGNDTTPEEIKTYFKMHSDLELVSKLKSKWTGRKKVGAMNMQFRSLPVATVIRIRSLFSKYNSNFTAVA